MARILIVEDNSDLAYGVRRALELEGHEVEVASDGMAGLERALEVDPDLIILDLMLPGLDGYGVLQELREKDLETPVIMLTARGEEADKVMGFRLGADQYVTKPFGLLELLARVNGLLQRADRVRDPEVGGIERFGDVEVDPAARTVVRAGQPVQLAPKEFDLLMALLQRRGAVASRLELLRDVWGHQAAVVTRTVDFHISELRRKLEEEPSNPRHILTVRKAGYRLQP